jgi:hypothetical protein
MTRRKTGEGSETQLRDTARASEATTSYEPNHKSRLPTLRAIAG